MGLVALGIVAGFVIGNLVGDMLCHALGLYPPGSVDERAQLVEAIPDNVAGVVGVFHLHHFTFLLLVMVL